MFILALLVLIGLACGGQGGSGTSSRTVVYIVRGDVGRADVLDEGVSRGNDPDVSCVGIVP